MLELSVRILLAAGLDAALATAALAGDGTARHPRLVFEVGPRSTAVANPRRFLTLIDGRSGDGAVSKGRSREVPFALADIGLTLELARLSSRLRPFMDAEQDSYSLRQLHVKGRLPVDSNVDVVLTGDAVNMVRTIASVPASARKGRVMAASAGLGLAAGDFSVTAQYETVGTRTRNRPMHRMAEILGGAPANREALALLMADGEDLGRGIRLECRFGARLARRTRDDLHIIGSSVKDRTEKVGGVDLTLTF